MALFANRYVIERVLGEGGMGVVYLVSDPLSTPPGRHLALKQIRPERLTPTVRAAMAREFRVLTRLRHPNLVEVYDFSTEPGCWFTMEHIEGQDLRSAGLTHDELVEAVVQACRALEYIHSRGLVHLDVKPSNILVARHAGELSVKLMDFGVASDPREAAPSGYTLGFVAPEIVEGRGFDGRADLYSLGMALLSLGDVEPSITWDVTIQVRALAPGRAQPVAGPIDLEHLPLPLARTALRLIRLDPTERFGSAAQVIDALAAASGRTFALETAATRTGYIHSGVLAGRDEELAHLLVLHGKVRGGEARHVLIEGASGLGKSRLVKELRVHAQLDGALVVTAVCAPGAPSHQAVAALVGQLGGASAAAGERTLAPQHVSELARLSFGLDPRAGAAIVDDLGQAAARSRLVEAVVALVGAAARGRPVIVAVEDVDFIDEASAQLLRALRARIAAGDLPGVLLVMTARRAGAFAVPETLRLAPLTARHVRIIIEDLLGPDVAPESFIERAVALSQGNGFFVSELLKLAADRELISRAGGGWSCDARRLAEADFPATAGELVGERVRLLPPGLRRLAWMASILGAGFTLESLEAAHGETAAADLDELVGRALVVAEGRTFRFAHGEVQAAVLGDARAGGEWAALNLALAEIAERMGGHPADVARLFLDSEARARALPHLEGAAALAEAVHDHATAVATYDRALALARELGAGRAAKSLHRRRLAAIRSGGLGDVDPRAEDALRAAGEDARAELEVRLELARIASRRGRFADAVAQAGVVLERAGALPSARAGERLSAEAHRVAGLARLSLGELPAALAELDAAAAGYEALGDDAGRSGALNDRGFVHGYAGDYGAALADHEAALAGLSRMPAGIALDALAATQNNLGFAAWNLGRYDVARGHLDEALALRRRLSDLHGEGVTRNNIGNVLRHRGDLDGAIAEYEAAIALCRRSGNVLYEAIALNNLGQIEEERDRLGRAEALYRLALDLVLPLGDRIREGDNLGSLGVCLLARGKHADARDFLRRAIALRRQIGDRAYLIQDLSYLALAELALAEPERARAAISEALDTLDAGQQGTEQVQAIYLNAYKTFLALGERARARASLARAAELLAARLGTAREAALRLRVNREIVLRCTEESLPI